MTAWNDFVKKIYHEGHNKDSNYSFKQALQDASARKGEMDSSSSPMKSKKMRKSKSKKSMKGGKSRKARKSRKSRKSRKARNH
jgi:hypothetical protein